MKSKMRSAQSKHMPQRSMRQAQHVQVHLVALATRLPFMIMKWSWPSKCITTRGAIGVVLDFFIASPFVFVRSAKITQVRRMPKHRTNSDLLDADNFLSAFK